MERRWDGEIPLDGCDPALLNEEEVMMGIDEAGRGPVLGPMVYGSAFCAVKDEQRLRAMGFDDSKKLTEAKRESLWSEVQSVGFIGWAIRVLHASEISRGMLGKNHKYNLNAMSHDAAIGLVKRVLDQGVKVRYLYVDTVGDPEHYQAKLQQIFPAIRVTVAKKADSTYPVVSAASICAKVPRDKILAAWRFDHPKLGDDHDWGCGYPGDKDTQRWLRDNLNPLFGWPSVARFSWGPALEVLDKNPQDHGAIEVRWPSDEDPSLDQQRGAMAAFLGGGTTKKRKARDAIFDTWKLEPVEAIDKF